MINRMKKLLVIFFALWSTAAVAQWQVTNGAVPLGRGSGKTGFSTATGSGGAGAKCLTDTTPPTFVTCVLTNPVNSGTAGQLTYYAGTGSVVSGNANFNVSGGTLTHGVAGSVVGAAAFANATSGTVTLQPVTGALGSSVISLPAATDTLVGKATTDVFSNKSMSVGQLTGQLALANGGSNASLTASNGGMVWSNATQFQILAGTVTAGQCLLSGSSAAPTWGACNVSSVTSIAGNTGAFTLGTGLTNSTNDIRVSLSTATNVLGADVLLNNTANYFDGPSMAQGTSGTWFASGTVTLTDSGANGVVQCKLWDGTTVIASGRTLIGTTTLPITMHLAGYLATPAANIRISCRDTVATTGKIVFNASGESKDASIFGLRIQ